MLYIFLNLRTTVTCLIINWLFATSLVFADVHFTEKIDTNVRFKHCLTVGSSKVFPGRKGKPPSVILSDILLEFLIDRALYSNFLYFARPKHLQSLAVAMRCYVTLLLATQTRSRFFEYVMNLSIPEHNALRIRAVWAGFTFLKMARCS